MRSMRFPNAPENANANANVHHQDVVSAAKTMKATQALNSTSATSQGTVEPIPRVAPGLYSRRSDTKPGISGFDVVALRWV